MSGVTGRCRYGSSHVFGDAGVIRMIRHDEAEIHRQLAAAPTGEEVVQAVRLARGHDRRRCRRVGESEVDGHAETSGDRREGVDDLIAFEAEPLEVELDALEEHGVAVARPRVDVLFGVHDVAVVVGEKLSGRRDDAGLIGAREQQDGGHDTRSTGELSRGGRGRSTQRRWRRRH